MDVCAADGTAVRFTAYELSGTLRDWIETCGDAGAFVTPLDAATLTACAAACECLMADTAVPPFEADALFDLIHAVNYLDVDALMEICAERLSEWLQSDDGHRELISGLKDALQPASEPSKQPDLHSKSTNTRHKSTSTLPPGWLQCASRHDGATFFYNVDSQETTWERPAEFVWDSASQRDGTDRGARKCEGRPSIQDTYDLTEGAWLPGSLSRTTYARA